MREIIHVDLDGFFVAVERQLNPALAGRAIVIGGQPATRGVVAAASAEAVQRGVRVGLSLAIAASRCPDAVFLDGDVERYLEASAAVDEILRDPATVGPDVAVEWTAIDSVFVEVGVAPAANAAGRAASGDGLRVAERLRERIARELGFDVSCGVASSRAAAQIASRMSRPRGVLYALPGYEARLLAPLDVGLLPELPPGTRQRLLLEGIATLGDLAGVGPERARVMLGARGPSLVRAAQGVDDRPVDRSQPPRSIAREVTLYPACTVPGDAAGPGGLALTDHAAADAPSRAATEAELAEVVRHLADVLAMRLRSMGWFARTVTLWLRPPAAGGHGARRSVTLREATALGDDLRAAAQSLLKTLWRRQPVGGIGLVLSNLQSAGPQMALFPLSRTEGRDTTLETVRARSGLRVLVDERYRPSAPRRVERPVDRSVARSNRPSAELRRRRTG